MPRRTMEEVEQRVFAAQPQKAPGEDGLPAVAWKQVWPAVKERALVLFQTSLDEGQLPAHWTSAKIIPLKKPGKEDYTIAKAWRPISLLSTLGKALESVVAERISDIVKTYRGEGYAINNPLKIKVPESKLLSDSFNSSNLFPDRFDRTSIANTNNRPVLAASAFTISNEVNIQV
jgi:hypothetical protein